MKKKTRHVHSFRHRLCRLSIPTPSMHLWNTSTRLSVNNFWKCTVTNIFLMRTNFVFLRSATGNLIASFMKCYLLKELRPSLNTQSDTISAQLYVYLVACFYVTFFFFLKNDFVCVCVCVCVFFDRIFTLPVFLS